MTYITAAELKAAMGENDYNKTLSLEGSATADTTTVTAILTRTDEKIDYYNTNHSAAQCKALAYPIAIYYAFSRRGPGNVSIIVKADYDEAIAELKGHRGIVPYAIFDPIEEPTEDSLDDLVEDAT